MLSIQWDLLSEEDFPNQEAAEIAVKTVKEFRKNNPDMEVIFNVFKEADYEIYRKHL